MVLFVNTFLSYLLLVLISAAIIVLAIFCGKKLRDYKDNKEANKEAVNNENVTEE